MLGCEISERGVELCCELRDGGWRRGGLAR